LKQALRDPLNGIKLVVDNPFRFCITLVQNLVDGLIRCLEGLLSAVRSGECLGAFRPFKHTHAEKTHDHVFSQLCGHLQVIGGAAGNVVAKELLRDVSARQADDAACLFN
jgi:hypothetical protein